MKKFLKILVIILVIVVLVVGGIFVYKKFIDNQHNSEKPVESAKKLDTVKNFDYVLYDNSTELYKEFYYELKSVLEVDDVDYEKYAELIGKMFITDFYTLSTKVTNQDIGGVDFIYSNYRDNFKLKASDTLYKSVESNVYGDRKQILPEVSEILSSEVSVNPYKFKSEEENLQIVDNNSYIVKLTWKYKEDLGYETKATIRLIHEKEKLSIVSIE